MSKLLNFFNQNINESYILKFKENLFEIKPGYTHILVLTNKKTNNHWCSSSNNPQEREKTLKYLLKKRDEWHGPWRELFGNLDKNEIEDQVSSKIVKVEDLDNEDLMKTSFDRSKFDISFFLPTINEYLKCRSYENNRDYKNLDFVKKIRESVETIIGGKENVFTFNLSDIDEAIEEIIATSIKMKHSH